MKEPVLPTRPSRAMLALATTGALTADAIHSLSQPLGVIGLAAYNMQRHAQSATASLDYLRATLATTEDQIDKAIDLIRGFQGLRARLQALPAPALLVATVDQAIALCRPALDSSNLDAASSAAGNSMLEISDGPVALAICINMILYATAALPTGDQATPVARERLLFACSRESDRANVVLRAANRQAGSPDQARSRDRQRTHGEILTGLAALAKATLHLPRQGADIIASVSLPCRP